jgi:peptidyl-Asp metalloendopeptidase
MNMNMAVRTGFLCLFLALPSFAAAADGGLFTPSSAKAAVQSDEIGVTRSRAVRVDFERFAVSAGKAAGSELRLDLFPDASFTAVLDRVAFETADSVSWVGHLKGMRETHVALVAGGGSLVGSVTLPGAAYRIRSTPKGFHVVEQLDLSAFPEGAEPLEVEEIAVRRPRRPGRGTKADDGSVIDLLVVYTPAARSASGGRRGIENLISLGVTETNTAFANSGIQTRLRLVHRTEIQYTESTERIGIDLQRLRITDDGFMDSVHALRNQYKADLVMLVGNSAVNACGVAYVMSPISPAFESSAFSYIARQCISPTYGFGHELAHNMGSDHAPDDPIGPAAYSYSYGYKDPLFRFRTMMAYPCAQSCTRVLRFSNPRIPYNGWPTGTATQDNAQSINNVRQIVANFRVSQ